MYNTLQKFEDSRKKHFKLHIKSIKGESKVI